MQKHILVLTENFPPKSGGSGRWFYELYTRLPQYQITVVTDDIDGHETFDAAQSIDIIRIPFANSQWGFKSLSGCAFYWRCFWQLRRIIKTKQITEIHCCRVMHEGVTAWLLSLFMRIKYVVFVHGEDVETTATSREQDLMVKQVCKHASQIICNSHNTANIVVRLHYAPLTATQVLHPGADTHKFVVATKTAAGKCLLGWEDRFVILTVGRLQARKGHDKMIDAVGILKEKIPNVLYAIIGDGECKTALQAQIAQANLTEHVLFMDEISDAQMIECYQQADVFILPNRTIDNDIEGFGMVLIEAQACGTVVIAGDSGGTKETMLVNETGFIIDCTEPKVIAQCILELYHDDAKRIAMGLQGREFVDKTFDWTPHALKASDIFRV